MPRLNDSNFHLPYNPKLIPIAKETAEKSNSSGKKTVAGFSEKFPFASFETATDRQFYCRFLLCGFTVSNWDWWGESFYGTRETIWCRKNRDFTGVWIEGCQVYECWGVAEFWGGLWGVVGFDWGWFLRLDHPGAPLKKGGIRVRSDRQASWEFMSKGSRPLHPWQKDRSLLISRMLS